MKITIVNTHDLVGGAERCSYDLATQFNKKGKKVSLIVGGKTGSDTFVEELKYYYPDYKFRFFLFEKLGITDTTLLAPIYSCFTRPSLKSADVYNIHNMHGAYWNFWTLPILAKRAPIVMTLHDEWFLTGDCTYSYDCQRFLKYCGKCPQVSIQPFLNRYAIGGWDMTRFNLSLKRLSTSLLQHHSMVVVAPSKWLLEKAKCASHLSRFDFRHIEYGIDLNIFRPMNKNKCRQHFNLPIDKKLVFMAASNLNDRRKNFKLVSELIFNRKSPSRVFFVCAGNVPQHERERYSGLPIRFLGHLKSKEDMAMALSACDISLVLSKADNLPYMAIEALACGCPPIGTRVGGIPEIIDDGVVGWIIPEDPTVQDLAHQLSIVCNIENSKLNDIAFRARVLAEKRYSMNSFISKHQELFKEVVARCALR